MSDTFADVCTRCGVVGHDLDSCVIESTAWSRNRFGGFRTIDKSDRFMHSCVDTRIIRLLPTELWQLLLSYLPVRDVIPYVPRTNKYLNDVVWGKWSDVLMWGEMTRKGPDEVGGSQGINATPYKWLKRDNKTKQNVLMQAVEFGASIEQIKILIKGGVNVNAKDYYGNTALHDACNHDKVEIVRVLLEAKSDPNALQSNNWTPLHCACYDGFASVTELLIEYGASLNELNNYEKTPLMMASMRGHTEIVRMLVNARADLTTTTGIGLTAHSFATFYNHVNVMNILTSQ
jgi:Ankyrin repeats (3 copies)